MFDVEIRVNFFALVRRSFIELLKRAPLILVFQMSEFTARKRAIVCEATTRSNPPAITITFMAASKSARDSSYATHVESHFFREIVHLQCCTVNAAKIFGR